MSSHFLIENVLSEVIFSTARSGGPGGQHVNKTETKVILKWNLFDSNVFDEEEKELLTKKLQNKLDSSGNIIKNDVSTAVQFIL